MTAHLNSRVSIPKIIRNAVYGLVKSVKEILIGNIAVTCKSNAVGFAQTYFDIDNQVLINTENKETAIITHLCSNMNE
jgi:hypothetical protein